MMTDHPIPFCRMSEAEALRRSLAAAERVRLKRLIRQMAGSDLDGKIGTMDVDQLRNVVEGLGGEV
jgi:uncharacterized tellurite resistance protein B-like protein